MGFVLSLGGSPNPVVFLANRTGQTPPWSARGIHTKKNSLKRLWRKVACSKIHKNTMNLPGIMLRIRA
jgi:hypothetical protein